MVEVSEVFQQPKFQSLCFFADFFLFSASDISNKL